MKALRFAWDHPGVTALGAVLAALYLSMLVQAPWVLGPILVVGGLSLRKALMNVERDAKVIEQAVQSQMRFYEDRADRARRDADLYRPAADAALTGRSPTAS